MYIKYKLSGRETRLEGKKEDNKESKGVKTKDKLKGKDQCQRDRITVKTSLMQSKE